LFAVLHIYLIIYRISEKPLVGNYQTQQFPKKECGKIITIQNFYVKKSTHKSLGLSDKTSLTF
jgi:hypothetical protein